ncbi:MAG: tRNA (N(6)-L-threonylcarbamoyladenosine(37)-C(2))-methylthiotransferase MtaB [Treponema sp.]|jgi:threonylcarbamoyladenosine tRNA methylthiotransferase MtaB|nr:tRNA (N(6)-L-threonylcarbamoyladenosine(37)-C(2))-methylthiotransferase MtaB [Treponema sp.]
MASVSIYTLGCKLNQLESEAVAGAFREAGFSVLPFNEDDPADVVIVNTCTVTSKAEQKARRIIRKLARNNACVIVSGCYARMDAEAIAAIDGRVLALADGSAGALLDLPAALAVLPDVRDGGARRAFFIRDSISRIVSGQALRSAAPAPAERFRYSPGAFSFHSRAFLKIQDGCNGRCAYCRVRLARGASVSLEAAQALSHLRGLEAKGYREATLTGVNINQYDAGMDLAGLVAYLLNGTERIRLRLSSLEPDGVTRELCAVISDARVCPHVHLSVQAGSDAVLAAMRRPYTRDSVERAAALVRSVKDDPFLGCDIIAGFPTETAADFEDTLALCGRVGFSWIHAFPYSPRPGTEAFRFTEKVPDREIARRVDALLALARDGRRSYIGRQIGKQAEAVIERNEQTPDGFIAGVTETYLKVLLHTPDREAPRAGEAASCTLTAAAPPRQNAFDMLGTIP